MRGLLAGILLYTVGQALIWVQTNGQFVWPWFKKNPLIISALGGTIISYMFIHATNYLAQHYNGELWPGRFIGQATGIVVFTLMTYGFLNEGLTTKTGVCLSLAIVIICIQIFWK